MSFADDAGGLDLGLFPFFADENGTIDNEVAGNATFYGFHIDLTPPNNPNVASAIAGSQQSGVGCRP